MGAKIIETGSTAGGIAKVEYKDEAGNVLWYYDDAGNFVRNGNAKITGLAGTGNRMVVADSSGNLSAGTGASTNGALAINATNLSSYATDGRILNTFRTTTNGTYKFGGIFADTYRDIANPNFTAGMWFESTTTRGGIISSTDTVLGADMFGGSTIFPTEGLRLISATNAVS